MADGMRRLGFALANGAMAGLEFGPARGQPDILFLHANGFNAHTYRSILAPLGQTYRVLAVDMRGHGRSTLPTVADDHRWQVYADDLRALLNIVGMPRVLAGHSMGGATALIAAPHLPPSVRLVLFDPVLGPKSMYDDSRGMMYEQPIAQGALRRKNFFASREAAFLAYRGRGAFTTWPEASLRDYLEDGLREQADGGVVLSCTPAWEAANFAAAMRVSPYAGLSAMRCSAQIFKSEIGSVCSLRVEDVAPGAPVRIETVLGSSHFLPMEHWDLVRSALSAA